jgi:hypothetical protein
VPAQQGAEDLPRFRVIYQTWLHVIVTRPVIPLIVTHGERDRTQGWDWNCRYCARRLPPVGVDAQDHGSDVAGPKPWSDAQAG